jgi:hypothetical protein
MALLYRVIKRLIETSKTGGLEEKIDVFYVAGKLTQAEYTELIDMLNQANT